MGLRPGSTGRRRPGFPSWKSTTMVIDENGLTISTGTTDSKIRDGEDVDDLESPDEGVRVKESKHFFIEDVAPRWASNLRPLHGNYGDE